MRGGLAGRHIPCARGRRSPGPSVPTDLPGGTRGQDADDEHSRRKNDAYSIAHSFTPFRLRRTNVRTAQKFQLSVGRHTRRFA